MSEVDTSQEAVEWIASRADEQELDYDTPVADVLRTLAAERDDLRAQLAEAQAQAQTARDDALAQVQLLCAEEASDARRANEMAGEHEHATKVGTASWAKCAEKLRQVVIAPRTPSPD